MTHKTYRPRTLEETLEIIDSSPCKIVAGGTDYMVALKHTVEEQKDVVFINHLDDLKQVYIDEKGLHIGTACTYTHLIGRDIIPHILKQAMRNIAAPAIRNQGTIGGNICNASPAGDTLPLLYIMDAKVVLKSIKGERIVPIESFIRGVRKIDLKDNEILTEIILDKIDEASVQYYYEKVGNRKADAISKVSFAGAIEVDNGMIKAAKFAFGAIGVTVVREIEIENYLIGKAYPLDDDVVVKVAEAYGEIINPIDDQRSTAIYRKNVALNLLKYFLKREIKVYKGNFVHAPTIEEIKSYENHYLITENGKVKEIKEALETYEKAYELIDYTDHLIIPGFVDLHVHAPQYDQIGLGLDLELIDWLNQYTFNLESKFVDTAYAKHVYSRFAKDIIRCGTTRASIFATIHKDSTKVLMDILDESGIGAFVGKVNMDQNSIEALTEDTEQSLKDTEDWIETTSDYKRVHPIITPRFSPSCTADLLKGLGKLALEKGVPVQSHISENEDEVQWVQALFPDSKHYSDTYDANGLFVQNRTLMAHGIYLTEDECNLIKEKEVTIVHCPDSNMNIRSGVMPIRELIDYGCKIGLGSDVGGGSKLSIASAMVSAIQNSKMYSKNTGVETLKFHEAFYLATKAGGEFFGNVGSFEENYEFDALVIDMRNDTFETLTPEEMLMRFVYRDMTERIKYIYCDGNQIK